MRIARSNTALLAVAALVLSACSDSMVTPNLPTRAAPTGGNFDAAVAGLSGVVLSGADLGAFTNAIAPSEITRVTGAFWDNVSSDDSDWGPGPAPAAGHKVKCNVGFYAVADANFGACLEMNGASLANEGGFSGGKYWGDNGGVGGGKDGSSFLFSGAYTYQVKLVGTFAGGTSEVGYFTKVGTTYTFHAVPGFGSKTVNTTITVNTNTLAGAEQGANWGFYVKNSALDATGSCAAQTACSDATGSFASGPFQQFALFINAAGTVLEMGLEDNGLTPLWTGTAQAATTNPTNKDSDYNDYIFQIVPSAIPVVSTIWCSPGYWKNHQDAWSVSLQNQLYNSHSAFYLNDPKTFVGYDFGKKVGSNNPTLDDVISNPSIYGGPATNNVASWISNQLFGTPITANPAENCPLS